MISQLIWSSSWNNKTIAHIHRFYKMFSRYWVVQLKASLEYQNIFRRRLAAKDPQISISPTRREVRYIIAFLRSIWIEINSAFLYDYIPIHWLYLQYVYVFRNSWDAKYSREKSLVFSKVKKFYMKSIVAGRK